MSVTKIYKFPDIVSMQYFLNGAVVAGTPPKNPQDASGWYGLIGKTLIFTSPSAGTVTFAAAGAESTRDPLLLQFADVKAQIETVMSTCLVTTINGRLAIIEKTPASGVAVAKTGTGNTLLGFDAGQATTGEVFAPPGAATPAVAPSWVWAYSINENSHVVFTLE